VRASLPLLGIVLLVGCVAHPAKTPRPGTVVVAGSPLRRASPDSTRPVVADATTPAPSSSGSTGVTQTDVTRRAIEVFGDSLVVAPPPKIEEESEPTWDLDVRTYETQERVAHYVSMFTGRSRERIADRLAIGTRYEPMIRAKMRAGGLPEDLYYLALVESGFNPHAYSKAAAVGMWQFMTSTARDMGMRVDGWVDERRDPVRSTAGAVRFIRGLRDQFGSLYLAAAAYNGGPGRVSRGLARYADDLENTPGDDAFFVLAEKDHLRNETREYVPQLIAAALIAKEPARYGMEIRTLPPLSYDSVRVPPKTPLAAIAKAARSSVREISELNPHILRGMTPPRDTYQVRIPAGSAAGFDSAFAALPDEDRVATRVVETKKGDTAEQIARKHGISVAALEAFNPAMRRLKPSRRPVPGQALTIPTPAVAAARLTVPDPTIERYPSSTAKLKVHTVRRGETMRGIAGKYGTTSERLMRINGLKKPLIFPGQTLLLSGTTAKSSRATRARVAAIKARNAELAAERKAGSGSREKVALSSKAVKASPRMKASRGASSTKSRTAKGAADASSSRKKAAVKPTPKKRSGADPKASARTNGRSAKDPNRAG
jgi:membrane-bound lytic murein transglycosylase D